MVKVLIVDDSAFMRNALTSMISGDPDITVVGIARDGSEAVEKVMTLKPDVVTLDVEMPRMDGLEALRQIMVKCPVPVLMVSSLTTDGAKTTLEALEIGAVDFIPKNLSDLSVNIVKIKSVLLEKIKHIGRKGLVINRVVSSHQTLSSPQKSRVGLGKKISMVTIGSSTGGPKALQDIITQIPSSFPVPILIAQHMPAAFTKPFAERLDQLSPLYVKEAESGEPLRKGTVYIAPGRGHMTIFRKKITESVVVISENRNEFIYKPSVDALMLSAVENFPGQILGIILTGLGNDGTKGMKEIKNTGGRTLAQNEETCVIYGMPRVVIESRLADKIVPLHDIAGEIINTV